MTEVLDDKSIGRIFKTDEKGELPQLVCGYCKSDVPLEINVLGGNIWSEWQYLCKGCRNTFLFSTEQRLDAKGKHAPRFAKLIEIWRQEGPIYANSEDCDERG